jgi:hypothetical protein
LPAGSLTLDGLLDNLFDVLPVAHYHPSALEL